MNREPASIDFSRSVKNSEETRQPRSALRIIKSAACKETSVPTEAPKSALGKMLSGFCDHLDREIEHIRTS